MTAPRCAALIAACAALLCAPAAAQVPAAEPAALFPSWSEQVAAIGMGSIRLGSPADLPTKGTRCKVAGAIGFTLGLVGDALWDFPVRQLGEDLPGGVFHTPLGSRDLDDLGAIFAKAVVCPSPLVHIDWVPPRPGETVGPVRSR